MSGVKKILYSFFVASMVMSSGAKAADMSLPYSAPASPAPMSELGTGWYLRGDGAYAMTRGMSLNATGSEKSKSSWDFDIGGGYRFNNWLRADATYEYHNQITSGGTMPRGCVIEVPVYDQNGTIVSKYDKTQPCQNEFKNKASLYAFFANGYIDLGTWSSITPYIGAGVGVSVIRPTAVGAYFNTDGSVFVDQKVDVQNGIVQRSGVSYNTRSNTHDFAWNVMGGVAIDVTKQLAIDVGYRYAQFGSIKSSDALTLQTHKSTLWTQEIRAGLRYMID